MTGASRGTNVSVGVAVGREASLIERGDAIGNGVSVGVGVGVSGTGVAVAVGVEVGEGDSVGVGGIGVGVSVEGGGVGDGLGTSSVGGGDSNPLQAGSKTIIVTARVASKALFIITGFNPPLFFKWFSNGDHPMGIAGVRPASDQGQPFVYGGRDPLGILAAHLFGHTFFFQNILLHNSVAIDLLPHIKVHFIARLQIDHIAENLSFDVVVSGDDHVVLLAWIG